MFAPSDRSTNENFVHSLRPNAGSGPSMSFSPVHIQKYATNVAPITSKSCDTVRDQIAPRQNVRPTNTRVLTER